MLSRMISIALLNCHVQEFEAKLEEIEQQQQQEQQQQPQQSQQGMQQQEASDEAQDQESQGGADGDPNWEVGCWVALLD